MTTSTPILITFKTTEIPAEYMEGVPPKKVEEILNLASDGTLWNSMEDFKCAKADAAGKKTKVIGGSTLIIVNPEDPDIIELGKFAVREHNKEAGTNLVFKQVVFGLQSPIGFIYVLVIRVQDGQNTRDCVAVIFDKKVLIHFRKLLLWGNLPAPLLI